MTAPAQAQGPLLEICDNARDDDQDGMIDLNDPDCDCRPAEPPSLIPNPSFEETDCCPSGNRELSCAKTWIQASEATTDYFHRCGYFIREEFPVPLPLPDGDAYIGFRNGRFTRNPNPNWKEYTGACLLSPLRAGTRYTIKFHIGFLDSNTSPPINVVLYGTTDCRNLPFGVGESTFGCPTNGPGWQELGRVFVSGSRQWIQFEITTTPTVDIPAIAIGPDCLELNLTTNPYYFLDNLILANTELFGPTIEAINHPCQDDFTLKASEKAGAAYQWYRDGIALAGETGQELLPNGKEGNYQVRTRVDSICLLSDVFDFSQPEFFTPTEVLVCPGDTYSFGGEDLTTSGSYATTLQNSNGCDSTILLNLKVLSETIDTLEAYFFKGEVFRLEQYTFNTPTQEDLILTSSLGCDSLVHLILKEYPVFIPNAFSPNGDGINDTFRIYGSEDFISIQSMKIYDRWGSQLFLQTDGRDFQWDAAHHHQSIETGVYIYVIEVILHDGTRKILSGDISLVK